MRTFSILRLMTAMMGMGIALPSGVAVAQAAAGCASIANDVAVAIGNDAARTLMIVEDALVINESCAAEIIKAAIVASNGDAEMANQIVQTGINVAPKMAAAITEAGASVAPGAIVASASNSEPAASEPAARVEPPAADAYEFNGKELVDTVAATNDGDESFAPVSSSVRGVYLVQQPPSGSSAYDLFRKSDHVSTSPCNCTP